MATAPGLKALPVELKRNVLGHVRDFKSLTSLVRAIPQFYDVYLDYRPSLLPQITFQELAARDCKLLTLPSFACCYTSYRTYSTDFPAIMEIIRKTHDLGKEVGAALTTQSPRLSITQCLAVLKVHGIIFWETAQFSTMGKDGFRSCAWLTLHDSLKKELDHNEVSFVGGLAGLENCLIILRRGEMAKVYRWDASLDLYSDLSQLRGGNYSSHWVGEAEKISEL